MLQLVASHHAFRRARQRCHWHRRTLHRMLERVVYAGVAAQDCRGSLARFLATLPHDHESSLVRVYGEHVFIFVRRDEGRTLCLLTVYSIPPAHRVAARSAARQQLALAA